MGVEGVDYSIVATQSFITGLAAAGKKACGRYIGPGGGTTLPGKILRAPERDMIFAAGMDIWLLAEGAASDWTLGYARGQAHAASALNAARALGAPDSTAIYFAIDTQAFPSTWPAGREYLRGAGSIIGVNRVGVYGQYDVMYWAKNDGVASWFFQTYAWSGSPTKWAAHNHVEQYHNGVYVAGGEVDLCRTKQTNYGQWESDMSFTDDDRRLVQNIERIVTYQCDDRSPISGIKYNMADPGRDLPNSVKLIKDHQTAQDQAIHVLDQKLDLILAKLSQGGGGLVDHTHEGGTTGPAVPVDGGV